MQLVFCVPRSVRASPSFKRLDRRIESVSGVQFTFFTARALSSRMELSPLIAAKRDKITITRKLRNHIQFVHVTRGASKAKPTVDLRPIDVQIDMHTHSRQSTCRIGGWYRPVVPSVDLDRVGDRRGVVAGVRGVTIVVAEVLLLLLLVKVTTCRVSLDVIAAVHLCCWRLGCATDLCGSTVLVRRTFLRYVTVVARFRHRARLESVRTRTNKFTRTELC